MCGIGGIWLRTGQPVQRSSLERMGQLLAHRGPDGFGTYLEGEIGLVSRRLSILDVSDAGHQPMALPGRRVWLTYNGEIHNYLELRRQLEAGGSRFHTRTDTEVVLHAYATWGCECFERFGPRCLVAERRRQPRRSARAAVGRPLPATRGLPAGQAGDQPQGVLRRTANLPFSARQPSLALDHAGALVSRFHRRRRIR